MMIDTKKLKEFIEYLGNNWRSDGKFKYLDDDRVMPDAYPPKAIHWSDGVTDTVKELLDFINSNAVLCQDTIKGRCKDCGNSYLDNNNFCCKYWAITPEKDGYCSKFEPKEGE